MAAQFVLCMGVHETESGSSMCRFRYLMRPIPTPAAIAPVSEPASRRSKIGPGFAKRTIRPLE